LLAAYGELGLYGDFSSLLPFEISPKTSSVEICINLVFLKFLKKILKASNSSKTPKMLLFIKGFGESIDLSTCVSAAKLNIQ
jgi:hypothetical protein